MNCVQFGKNQPLMITANIPDLAILVIQILKYYQKISIHNSANGSYQLVCRGRIIFMLLLLIRK